MFLKRPLTGLLVFFISALDLVAQNGSPAETPTPQISDKAAAGIAAVIGGMVCIFGLVYFAIWLSIAIWVTKDAQRRESPNATLVTILAWIPPTAVIGLIVH